MNGKSVDDFYESQNSVITELKLQLKSIYPDELVKESTLKNAINKALSEIRNTVRSAVRSSFPTNKHKMDQAVSIMKYKSIWGGNVNIYGRRIAGTPIAINKIRKRHRYISERTKQVEGYQGRDRAFILKVFEFGTTNGQRMAGLRSSKGGYGNRGVITAKNIFANSAPRVTEISQQKIERVIETIQKHNWDSYGS